jgi:hypothetical protein
MEKPERPLLKKTTLLIPEALWLKARRRALDERTNLRTLLLEGLEMRLGRTAESWATERKKGGKR